MRIAITETGNKYYIKDTTKEFHTKEGYIKKNEIQKTKAKTSKGIQVYLFDAEFLDKYKKIERKAQIPMPKDIGTIITETGIGKNSIIVDAGSGSGGISLFLANIAQKVYTYDIREDHLDVVKRNIKTLELKNIEAKNKDITKGIEQKDVDVMILDIPEPWTAIKTAKKTIKRGGYLVCYVPCITQTQKLAEELKEFIEIRTLESIQREWHVEGQKIRPKTQGIMHTGFLTIARKK